MSFDIWKVTVEDSTGFKCYEDSTNNQLMFYGISANFNAFKTAVSALTEHYIPTGSIVFLMDNGKANMYYAPTDTFYEV
jgi:hypothetical protein